MRLILLCLSFSAALVMQCADAPKARQRNRSSAPGYSDTPMLPGQKWRVHDIARPKPPIVDPGTPSTLEKPGRPPSDAIVLFNGKDLSKWEIDGKAPGWRVQNGYMEVVGKAGTLRSREKFGNAQIHVEWMSPPDADGSGQWRGNSGILIMGVYEIQVLDSHNNPTYSDGQAGAIYGQWPPLVNASRKPGEWQMYDIVFEAPEFKSGKLSRPAFVTVFHNGVLLHHRKQVIGPMAHKIVKPYELHAPEQPLALQDHDVPVRYRNIWVRRLKDYDQP